MDAREMIFLATNSLIWSGIAYMAFCRSLILGGNTRWAVSIGVAALGTSALGMAFLPYVPKADLHPHMMTIGLGAALFVFLFAFRESWKYGPPFGTHR